MVAVGTLDRKLRGHLGRMRVGQAVHTGCSWGLGGGAAGACETGAAGSRPGCTHQALADYFGLPGFTR